jgi:hypothetical protein
MSVKHPHLHHTRVSIPANICVSLYTDRELSDEEAISEAKALLARECNPEIQGIELEHSVNEETSRDANLVIYPPHPGETYGPDHYTPGIEDYTPPLIQ